VSSLKGVEGSWRAVYLIFDMRGVGAHVRKAVVELCRPVRSDEKSTVDKD
jgi:hypothetical protein